MPAARQRVKSAAAFRTISEVSTDLDVPQHVLRFWESKFTAVRPLKRGGGRRYYRPEDVELLRRIRNLLYTDGYTIKGVQRLLREGHGKLEPEAGAPGTPRSASARLRFRDCRISIGCEIRCSSIAWPVARRYIGAREGPTVVASGGVRPPGLGGE